MERGRRGLGHREMTRGVAVIEARWTKRWYVVMPYRGEDPDWAGLIRDLAGGCSLNADDVSDAARLIGARLVPSEELQRRVRIRVRDLSTAEVTRIVHTVVRHRYPHDDICGYQIPGAHVMTQPDAGHGGWTGCVVGSGALYWGPDQDTAARRALLGYVEEQSIDSTMVEPLLPRVARALGTGLTGETEGRGWYWQYVGAHRWKILRRGSDECLARVDDSDCGIVLHLPGEMSPRLVTPQRALRTLVRVIGQATRRIV